MKPKKALLKFKPKNEIRPPLFSKESIIADMARHNSWRCCSATITGGAVVYSCVAN